MFGCAVEPRPLLRKTLQIVDKVWSDLLDTGGGLDTWGAGTPLVRSLQGCTVPNAGSTKRNSV